MRYFFMCVLIAGFQWGNGQELARINLFHWDSYHEHKVKHNIEEQVHVSIDAMRVDSVMRSDGSLKRQVHLDYTIHNQSEFQFNKLGFRILAVNEHDELDYEIPVGYYNTVKPGHSLQLRKCFTLKAFESFSIKENQQYVILFDDAFVVFEDQSGMHKHHLTF